MYKITPEAIIKEAERLQKKQRTTKTKVKTPKEVKSYIKATKAYKSKTGKKRLSRGEKILLQKYTASQVARGRKLSAEVLAKRQARFRAIYGTKHKKLEKELRYYTPAQLAKHYNLEPIKEETDEGEIKKFTEAKYGIDYERLPDVIKGWSHSSGMFLYENSIWDNPTITDEWISDAVDCPDHNVDEFLDIALKNTGYDNVRTPTTRGLIVKYSEAVNVYSLDVDYMRTRLYRSKYD